MQTRGVTRERVYRTLVSLLAIPWRAYAAIAVFAATAGVAAWVYTYRSSETFEYIDLTGKHFHPSDRVRTQPWWDAPLTVLVLCVGVTAAFWLLPSRRRVVRRARRLLFD